MLQVIIIKKIIDVKNTGLNKKGIMQKICLLILMEKFILFIKSH